MNGQYSYMLWGESARLYYARARYYDPRVGRFLSLDPLSHTPGLNVYAYVGTSCAV